MNSSKTSHKNHKQSQKIAPNWTGTQKQSKVSERVQKYKLEDLRWLQSYEPFGPI